MARKKRKPDDENPNAAPRFPATFPTAGRWKR